MAANHNWAAAFTAYCNGSPVEEVSMTFDIPLKTLVQKVQDEGWTSLRAKLPLSGELGVAPLANEITAKLAVVKANRIANLEVAVELRKAFVDQILKPLAAQEVQIERLFHNKGMVVRAEQRPGPADWVNIAAAAKTIADLTYRALGDVVAGERAQSDTPAAAGGAAPTITIILPNVVARPREERQIEASQVVEVQSTVTATEQ